VSFPGEKEWFPDGLSWSILTFAEDAELVCSWDARPLLGRKETMIKKEEKRRVGR